MMFTTSVRPSAMASCASTKTHPWAVWNPIVHSFTHAHVTNLQVHLWLDVRQSHRIVQRIVNFVCRSSIDEFDQQRYHYTHWHADQGGYIAAHCCYCSTNHQCVLFFMSRPIWSNTNSRYRWSTLYISEHETFALPHSTSVEQRTVPWEHEWTRQSTQNVV